MPPRVSRSAAARSSRAYGVSVSVVLFNAVRINGSFACAITGRMSPATARSRSSAARRPVSRAVVVRVVAIANEHVDVLDHPPS